MGKADRPSQMNEALFVQAFGAIYEHSPWVAQRTWQRRLTAAQDSLDGLAAEFAISFTSATRAEKLEVILAHPDLAGKAAVSGELTPDSSNEQASAGINQCSPAEFEQFQKLNQRYKSKFEFPFIMAVRGSNKNAILDGFNTRLLNDTDEEFDRAITEINQIARFRLEDFFA